jgi:hypothetical protein
MFAQARAEAVASELDAKNSAAASMSASLEAKQRKLDADTKEAAARVCG